MRIQMGVELRYLLKSLRVTTKRGRGGNVEITKSNKDVMFLSLIELTGESYSGDSEVG